MCDVGSRITVAKKDLTQRRKGAKQRGKEEKITLLILDHFVLRLCVFA
jgi:hypothetical protein